ncbi:hypothetical protein ABCW44_09350 [Mannheimia haemolytica]|uniref:hypothetical protein n=1 Tax=Mannheimia haemolytica TaxID=75985 RepID=UPI002EC102BE|nr:hypothetical protein [Mannheimia haemolytica]
MENRQEKSPIGVGLYRWKVAIARYVAFQAVRYLYRVLFAGTPMPEAFGVWPVVKSAVPFSPPAHHRKEIGNKTGLVILSCHQSGR